MKQKLEECEKYNFVIDHTDRILSNIKNLYLSTKCSDVSLLVDSQMLPAHRFILAASSEYFRFLFYGKHDEANEQVITLPGQYNAFQPLLQYFYTGQLSLVGRAEPLLLEILQLAELYNLDDIVSHVFKTYFENLNVDNAFKLFWLANMCNRADILDKTANFIDCHSYELIQRNLFKYVPKDTLSTIIARDSFYAQELDILNVVIDWGNNHLKESIEFVLPLIRFKSINSEHLNTMLIELGFKNKKLADLVNKRKALSNCPPRPCGFMLEKKESEKRCTYVWPGERKLLLSNVVFQMPKKQQINYIEMELSYGHFKYSIECSDNGANWEKVVDFSKNDCHSRQCLHFRSRQSLFIRVISVGQRFWVRKFAAANNCDESKLEPYGDCLVIRGHGLLTQPNLQCLSNDKYVESGTELIIHYNSPININYFSVLLENACKRLPRMSFSRDGKSWEFGGLGTGKVNLLEYMFSMRLVSFVRFVFYDIDRPIRILDIKHKPVSWIPDR